MGKETKSLPEDELRYISQVKIKKIKDALDEASIKFYCCAVTPSFSIENDDEGNVTLAGSLLAEASIVTTTKVK